MNDSASLDNEAQSILSGTTPFDTDSRIHDSIAGSAVVVFDSKKLFSHSSVILSLLKSTPADFIELVLNSIRPNIRRKQIVNALQPDCRLGLILSGQVVGEAIRKQLLHAWLGFTKNETPINATPFRFFDASVFSDRQCANLFTELSENELWQGVRKHLDRGEPDIDVNRAPISGRGSEQVRVGAPQAPTKTIRNKTVTNVLSSSKLETMESKQVLKKRDAILKRIKKSEDLSVESFAEFNQLGMAESIEEAKCVVKQRGRPTKALTEQRAQAFPVLQSVQEQAMLASELLLVQVRSQNAPNIEIFQEILLSLAGTRTTDLKTARDLTNTVNHLAASLGVKLMFRGKAVQVYPKTKPDGSLLYTVFHGRPKKPFATSSVFPNLLLNV